MSIITKAMEQDDHGLSQAKAQYDTLAEMVAALNCDYERLEELKDERDSHQDAEENFDPDGWALENPDEAEELAELIDEAGDCTDQDDAQQRIQEDPLEVSVRTDWHSPGSDEKPTHFMILLCTGGPAVRIVGELSEYGEPDRAWIEYQDWFTPWTELVGYTDQGTLLTYCRQFYFGD